MLVHKLLVALGAYYFALGSDYHSIAKIVLAMFMPAIQYQPFVFQPLAELIRFGYCPAHFGLLSSIRFKALSTLPRTFKQAW